MRAVKTFRDLLSALCTVPKSPYDAYFFVHSLAVSLYFLRSVLKTRAISGTSGSSGLGSVRREHTDKSTEKINQERT